MGPTAEPFLVRVTKADAPNYADVVTCARTAALSRLTDCVAASLTLCLFCVGGRNPMDLGSMSRKLRAGTYLCVADFADDIRLIAANAALYNGAASPYTHMAAALRENALRWLSALPASELDVRHVACGPLPGQDVPAEVERDRDNQPRTVVMMDTGAPGTTSPVSVTLAPSPMQQPDGSALEQSPDGTDGKPHAASTEACNGAAAKSEHACTSPAAPAAAVPALVEPDDLLSACTAEMWHACMFASSSGLQPLDSLGRSLPPLPRMARSTRRGSSAMPVETAGSAAGADLDDACARTMLRACIAPLLRDAGFSAAHASAMDTLIDVTAAHLTDAGLVLRRVADQQLSEQPADARAPCGTLVPAVALTHLQRSAAHAATWERLAALGKLRGAAGFGRRASDADVALPAAKRPHVAAPAAAAVAVVGAQDGTNC